MKLIIGLGNPGLKYKKTRHNVGFQVIDKISAKCNVKLRGNHVALRKVQSAKLKFDAELFKGKIDDEKVILAKPQTFMNRSGQAIYAIANYYKIEPEDIWIIHDDIDLPLGTLRISQGSGSAGHKGVQSIINHLKTKNFLRFRVGVSPTTQRLNLNTERFVLQNFTKPEEKIIKDIIIKTVQAIETALKEGLLPSTILLTSKF